MNSPTLGFLLALVPSPVSRADLMTRAQFLHVLSRPQKRDRARYLAETSFQVVKRHSNPGAGLDMRSVIQDRQYRFACFMAKKTETRSPFVLVRCSVDRQVGSDSMVI